MTRHSDDTWRGERIGQGWSAPTTSLGEEDATGVACETAEAVLDVASATARLGGDAEILREIMRIFLEESPRMLANIRGALRARDGRALELAAHSLKGSAANLGAARVAVLAAALETMGRESCLQTADGVWTDLEVEAHELRGAIAAILAG
jgi:two-component system, sensor histidine kinase and response regulator